MGYNNVNYILKESYGDEDQNSLMWLIESWLETDDDVDSDIPEPVCTAVASPVLNTPAETVPVEEFDDLPF